MAEAMFERSPDYFQKFSNSFRYIICDTVPDFTNFSIKNYAHGIHNSNKFCTYSNDLHLHILLQCNKIPENLKKLSSHIYKVPCLYTCFKHLIASTKYTVLKGEIFDKLQTAVDYNAIHSLETTGTSIISIRKLLPHVQSKKDLVQKTTTISQTDSIASKTIERLINILNSENSGLLLQIMDILESGYGSVHFVSQEPCVKASFSLN